MDDTGIEVEELYSNKELEILTLPFELLGEKDNGILISGVALTEGVWKNVIYSAKEIKKVASSLIGKPLLVEHGNTKEFGDTEVGKVTKSYYEAGLRGIVFEGLVTHPLAKRLVKKGILPAVSCSTWMEKRAINEQIRIGSDYNFSELSLVRTPACDRCFIFHKEQLSLWKREKPLSKGERKDSKEEITMGKEYESFESLDETTEAEELSAPTLLAVIELPDEDSLENLRSYRRVVSWYFGKRKGYPYYRKRKYKYKYAEKKTDEDVLMAVVELDSKVDLDVLRDTYNVIDAYYDAPIHSLSKEDLQNFAADLKAVLKEFTHPREKGDTESAPGPLMAHQTGAPNPEQCEKFTCPVDDKEFDTVEEFKKHWDEEHKEKYGAFKETMTILLALANIVDLGKGDKKIMKTKTGRFIAMIDTGKIGFGQWKIVGNFATRAEAEAALKGKKKEEKAEEPKKDTYGCVIGKEKWDKKTEKCVPVTEEEMSAYTDFIAKCRKDGKSMKECAAEWAKKGKKVEGPEEKQMFKCPGCQKKFPDMKSLAEHWEKEHKADYGPLKRAYKYPEKKSGQYFYFTLRGKYYPYYYKDGKYYKKYKYPKDKK